MIFVDTCVWSVAFRRRQESADIPIINQLKILIEKEESLIVPGIVFQELLSGLKEEAQFNRMYQLITGFTILLANESQHKLVAQIANNCRRNGVVTSTSDCLIAAMAISYNAQLLTTDKDFSYMANYCDLKLYPIEVKLKYN
jgi:predicted nucleic acid-binding protein